MQKSLVLLTVLLGLAAATAPIPKKIRGEKIDFRFQQAMATSEEIRVRHGLSIARQSSGLAAEGGLFALAQGIAYGLQYSPSKSSPCYTAVSNSITDAHTISQLLIQIYNPVTWSDLALISQAYTNTFAAINAYCQFDIVINTITTALDEGLSKFGARIAGASMYQFPTLMAQYSAATNSFDRGVYMGQALQILLNYSI